ncbi:hypothetical protein RMSM_01076 [Rhodopirellula maiorica SM1]|uniref:eCIS core domain-containing protein n=2 Tax=Novipirellula TaxID=2795426 RepID=M5S733_9BACT|nr:hypothetical protein RMSM_01076 [Rhodopirellula maiorica SM1]
MEEDGGGDKGHKIRLKDVQDILQTLIIKALLSCRGELDPELEEEARRWVKEMPFQRQQIELKTILEIAGWTAAAIAAILILVAFAPVEAIIAAIVALGGTQVFAEEAVVKAGIGSSSPENSTKHKSIRNGANANQSSIEKSAPKVNAKIPQSIIQPKLTINTPGDKYEQEADRVAEQVMRMPEPKLQRKCSCVGSMKSGECPECKKKKKEASGTLQRVASAPVGGMTAPPIVHNALNSPGSPLPAVTRSFMESRFAQDFNMVRVHTDSHAESSAQAISARAYTVGQDIVFGRGQFQPESSSGRHLLAHELAHVVQQQGNLAKPRFGAGGSQAEASSPSRASDPTTLRRKPEVSSVSESVTRVTISCSDRRIVFETPSVNYVYALNECDLSEGSYLANVSTANGKVRFELANAPNGLRFKFVYDIAPGQVNPARLFKNQTSVAIEATAGLSQSLARKADVSLDDQQQTQASEQSSEETDYQQFKSLVINAGKLRLLNNKKNLEEWKTFIEQKLSTEQLDSLVLAEKTRQLDATAEKRGTVADLDRFYRAESPVEREYAKNLVTGAQCPSCHAEQRVWQSKSSASQNDRASRAWTPIENRMRLAADQAARQPIPRPDFIRDLPSSPASKELSSFTSVESARTSRNMIRPYLEPLGPQGYRIIGANDGDGSPEEVRTKVLAAIAQRIADYEALMQRISEPDFDYLELRPIVRDLLIVASEQVRNRVNGEIASAESWETVKNIAVGLAALGTLVLIVFPPTSALGAAGAVAIEGGLAAYGVVSGIESVEKGSLYSLGQGANDVFDPEQQDAARVLQGMGYLSVGLSAVGAVGTTLKSVRLVRSVAGEGKSAAGTVTAIEGEAQGFKVRVTQMETPNPRIQVLDDAGNVVREGPADEFAGAVAKSTKSEGTATSLGEAPGAGSKTTGPPKVESVEDFLKRGGKITKGPSRPTPESEVTARPTSEYKNKPASGGEPAPYRGRGSEQMRKNFAHDLGAHQGHEMAAERGLTKVFDNPRGPSSTTRGFDSIYRTESGELVIVEFKGGTATLRPRQMTNKWVNDEIANLERELPFHPVVKELRSALRQRRLSGETYSTKIDEFGRPSPTTVQTHGTYREIP